MMAATQQEETMSADSTYDVAILGGGLAGLTLAIQLKRQRPETSVAVLEKREGPAPLAAFKVGESTRPLGAHYFAEVVGMKDHLEEEQLTSAGCASSSRPATTATSRKRVEHGPPTLPAARQLPDRPRPVRERARGPRPRARGRRPRRAAASRTSSSATTCTR